MDIISRNLPFDKNFETTVITFTSPQNTGRVSYWPIQREYFTSLFSIMEHQSKAPMLALRYPGIYSVYFDR